MDTGSKAMYLVAMGSEEVMRILPRLKELLSDADIAKLKCIDLADTTNPRDTSHTAEDGIDQPVMQDAVTQTQWAGVNFVWPVNEPCPTHEKETQTLETLDSPLVAEPSGVVPGGMSDQSSKGESTSSDDSDEDLPDVVIPGWVPHVSVNAQGGICGRASTIAMKTDSSVATVPAQKETCKLCCTREVDSSLKHCRHTFCKTCIQRWLRFNSNCPACNSRSSQGDVTSL